MWFVEGTSAFPAEDSLNRGCTAGRCSTERSTCAAPSFRTVSGSLRGPILRTVEGQEGAVLCNDDESLCTASRENSLADCGVVSLGSYDDCPEALDMASRSRPALEPQAAAEPERAKGCSTPDGSSELDEEEVDTYRSDDEQFSDVGELGDTEVVYVREGVAVWPTKSERIMGRLSLIKQHRVMFLAWLPYSNGSLNEDGTFQLPAHDERGSHQHATDRTMYAVHPIPLSEVKAIRKHTPSFGWHYIIVVLINGLTLPPLYFNNGGIKALFSALKQHAFLVKSSDDPNTHLINDTADPLQRSLTSLELTDILLGAPPPGASSTFAPTTGEAARAWAEEQALKPPLMHTVLENFQRVTQLARDTTSSFFATASYFGPAFPPEEAGMLSAPSMAVSCPQLMPAQSAHASLARVNPLAASPPSGPAAAAAAAAAAQALEERQRSGEDACTTGVGVFELIEKQATDGGRGSGRRLRPPPLSLEEWGTFLNGEGRLVDEKGFRQRVFYSGVEPGLRREAWKFLLGFYPMDSTAKQRAALLDAKRREYEQLKAQWTTITDAQAAMHAKWRERRSRVDKDVRRTDRMHPFYSGERNANIKSLRRILLTYSIFNFDLGYCQGMSDLASPMLYVMRDEAEAFWCFAALMERLESNFHTDSRGMHAQLLALRNLIQLVDPKLHAYLEGRDCLNYFFCYRWLLIHFKREFTFDEVLRLWEALWSRHLTKNMHIYLVAAVLELHRRNIMEGHLDFDSLLKFCVELSGKLDLDHALRNAELLCEAAGAAGKECLANLLPYT
ncbi:hypothetical protein WJX72_007608 [[Myrmecia] bisecta]|uniref:Rab-GAP TBC domain-containing protein n=1 Tax=[Myrmecia] bisecta TaxID=41462 RepID=A0AAW1PXK9_9CHLO